MGRAITSTVAWAALVGGCGGEPPTLPSPGIDLGSSGAVGDDDDASASTSGDDGGVTTGPDLGDTTAPDGSSSGGEGVGVQAVCGHTCSADEDCLFVVDRDFDYVCHQARCLYGPYICADDEDCVGALAGWTMNPCTATTQCPDDFACVDVGDGTGGCASTQNCAMAGLMAVMAVEIPSGNSVLVCGSEGGNCVAGICEPGCVDDRDCNGLSCDAGSGTCVCTSDAQCVAQLTSADTCIDGRCFQACTAPDDCLSLSFYRGGTVTCE